MWIINSFCPVSQSDTTNQWKTNQTRKQDDRKVEFHVRVILNIDQWHRRSGSESNITTWFETSMGRRGRCSEYRVFNKSDEIQGNQEVSVNLMVMIQKVTSNVQSVPRQPPDIYWHAELCSRKPFSIARSTFRMYYVMVIFISSVVWGLFEYTESDAQRHFNYPV